MDSVLSLSLSLSSGGNAKRMATCERRASDGGDATEGSECKNGQPTKDERGGTEGNKEKVLRRQRGTSDLKEMSILIVRK